MNLKKAVRQYINAKKALIKCKQEHFKQLCSKCRYYKVCLIHDDQVDAWIQLQEVFKATK